MITNYWERDALPVGVLMDCRIIMGAESEMRPAQSSAPTQDLLAGER